MNAYGLHIQGRAQHIRREKSAWNMCSNHAFCALRAVVYLSLLGNEGFRKAAIISMERAEYLKHSLKKIRGVDVLKGRTFNEFTVALPGPAIDFARAMLDEGFAAGVPASLFYPDRPNQLVVAATEKISIDDIDRYTSAAKKVLS